MSQIDGTGFDVRSGQKGRKVKSERSIYKLQLMTIQDTGLPPPPPEIRDEFDRVPSDWLVISINSKIPPEFDRMRWVSLWFKYRADSFCAAENSGLSVKVLYRFPTPLKNKRSAAYFARIINGYSNKPRMLDRKIEPIAVTNRGHYRYIRMSVASELLRYTNAWQFWREYLNEIEIAFVEQQDHVEQDSKRQGVRERILGSVCIVNEGPPTNRLKYRIEPTDNRDRPRVLLEPTIGDLAESPLAATRKRRRTRKSSSRRSSRRQEGPLEFAEGTEWKRGYFVHDSATHSIHERRVDSDRSLRSWGIESVYPVSHTTGVRGVGKRKHRFNVHTSEPTAMLRFSAANASVLEEWLSSLRKARSISASRSHRRRRRRRPRFL